MALKWVEEGKKITDVARRLEINRLTIYNWINKKEKTGSLKDTRKPRRCSKVDMERLEKLIEERPDAYQHELAEILKVSRTAIGAALKRLRISRKKKQHTMKNLQK